MKLMRYSRKGEKAAQARLGVLVGNDLVADLRAGYARYLIEEIGNPKGRELAAIFLPPYVAQFLHVGAAAWEALSETYGWLSDLVKSEPMRRGSAVNNYSYRSPSADFTRRCAAASSSRWAAIIPDRSKPTASTRPRCRRLHQSAVMHSRTRPRHSEACCDAPARLRGRTGGRDRQEMQARAGRQGARRDRRLYHHQRRYRARYQRARAAGAAIRCSARRSIRSRRWDRGW